MDVPAGTVVVYSDIACPWATVAVHRFHQARSRLGLDGRLHLQHRLYLLEDVNHFAVPARKLDAEIPVVGQLAPELGMKPWQGDRSEWPVTSLPANEAVHAAAAQSPDGAEELDMALRLAFFRDSRCISMVHEIVDIARGCAGVDADAVAAALDDGRARGPMMKDYRGHSDEIQGSPQFFLPNGESVHNPGVELHWQEDAGYPVVDADDPSAIDGLLARVAEQ